jgi:hypothetical protein
MILSMSTDDDTTITRDAGTSEDWPVGPGKPVAAVKCPDCDLCDGSGRCVEDAENCYSAIFGW